MIEDIPSSSPEGKNWIKHQLLGLSGKSISRVLDIGCGAATYYHYYNNILSNAEWTGVEIWPDYLEEYKLNQIYKNVIIDHANHVDYTTLERFEIVFVGDVLEHMEKQDAVELVHKLMKQTDYLFISIPIVYYPCDEYQHNPHLRHIKSDWSDEEVMAEFGQYVQRKDLGKVVGTYLLSNTVIQSDQPHYYFMSGLPRSGSTVLSAILNQNPNVFVTPTSPLLDQLVANQNIWHNLQTVKANPIPVQLDNITREMIAAMWQHIEGKHILDKNRGWGKNMPAAETLFGYPVKMIATVRDLPSIMASWLVLLRDNPDSYMDIKLQQQGLAVNDANRMQEMWSNMVRDCYESLLAAMRDAPEQLLIIDYDQLVTEPDVQIGKIQEFLGIPEYSYCYDNISSGTVDDDLAAWGLRKMHVIRSHLKKTSCDAKEVLGDQLYEYFVKIDLEFWNQVPERFRK